MEIWKDVPGYEGFYQASNYGNIRSLKRNTLNGSCNIDKLLKPFKKKGKDYLYVSLCKNGKFNQIAVHSIVLNTFIGKSKLQCNHKNGIKTDNNLNNLEWVTSSENIQHAYKNGLSKIKRGEEKAQSILNEKQVKIIKSAIGNVEFGYFAKLAREFGVSPYAIYNVIQNKTWKHVKL